MNKKIKQYGNSAIILLDREDLEYYGLKIGDWVNIDDIVKIKKKRKKK